MISVVIPCLNEVEFIDATLESLLRQEPPGVDWEVIVADGGSTDGTREKIENWSKRHPVIRWIENPKRTTFDVVPLARHSAKSRLEIRFARVMRTS